MKNPRQIIGFPFFLVLLPVFFVLHGYVQNTKAVTPTDALELTCEFIATSALLFGLGFLLFRRWQKAALFSVVLLMVQLFFGAVQDGLKAISPNFFLAKYSVLLPLIALLFAFFLVYLRKSKPDFKKLFVYLNTILLLLILIDLPAFFSGRQKPLQSGLPLCTACDKPDVYLIIADEYADSVSLNDVLHFNNAVFQSQLRSRGFHVVEGSRGNYNFTPFATASIMQMDYLQNIVGSNSNLLDINACQGAINHNLLLSFFTENGYDTKNFSIFTINGQPAQVEQKYLVVGKGLLRSQTLTEKLQRDIGFHLVTTLKLQSEIERFAYHTKKGNDKLISLLQTEVRRQSAQPRFVYTHLLMPHYPYYFDKNGKERPLNFFKTGYETNTTAYVEYLQYCNGIFIKLIDDILKHSAKPPVIVFMGDHGFREYPRSKTPDAKYYFMNMNAVLLPGNDYSLFYKGITGVNQFRALLNSTFGQHLPMLKDSTILINE